MGSDPPASFPIMLKGPFATCPTDPDGSWVSSFPSLLQALVDPPSYVEVAACDRLRGASQEPESLSSKFCTQIRSVHSWCVSGGCKYQVVFGDLHDIHVTRVHQDRQCAVGGIFPAALHDSTSFQGRCMPQVVFLQLSRA